VSKIVCRGYGASHGYAAGRLWFVCSKCRWSPTYRDPAPSPKEVKAQMQRDAVAKARA
jgi:hypothetical protein